jgi:hypothetical protein
MVPRTILRQVVAAAAVVGLCLRLQWMTQGFSLLAATSSTCYYQSPTSHNKSLSSYAARTTTNTTESSLEDEHHLCWRLPRGKSASALWLQYSDEILQTSTPHGRVSDVPVGQNPHGRWMTELFALLSPAVLARGLVTAPLPNDLKMILKTIAAKYQSPASAEPLRIAVFGGSVTEGRGCHVLPVELDAYLDQNNTKATTKTISGKACSWVHRLQLLADRFLGPGVVEVTNLAAGGTSSNLAVPILRYGLYKADSPLKVSGGAHIVINAYATNDGVWHDTKKSNAFASYEHYETTLAAAAAFGQAALESRPCQRPLVLFLGEYFGNHHELLLGEEIRHDAVRSLAQHSGWGYVSSAFVVRPWVYANTNETLFSPNWWTKSKSGVQERRIDGHFGMPGHQMIAWALAYASLQAIVDSCDDWYENKDRPWAQSNAQLQVVANNILATPSPPHLWNTTPTSVGPTWETKALYGTGRENDTCTSSSQHAETCVFAFVSTPAGTHRKRNSLGGYLRSYQTSNTGWNAEDDMRNGWQVGGTFSTRSCKEELQGVH